MADKPLLVLLPGLDGTGKLFAPFVERASADFELSVCAYDHEADQSYERLARALSLSLPSDRRYTLIAESFAGPVALRVAAENPKQLDALVLVNTFARSPLSTAQELALPLASRVPLALAPAPLLRRYLLGDEASGAEVAVTRAALESVPAAVLRARLATLATCDESESYLRCMQPMFYLHGTRDRLLSANALSHLSYLRPGLVVAELDAPHALVQRAPDAALAQLRSWLLYDRREA